jgi:flagellar biogenesis protein FliO/LysM repeat protein
MKHIGLTLILIIAGSLLIATLQPAGAEEQAVESAASSPTPVVVNSPAPVAADAQATPQEVPKPTETSAADSNKGGGAEKALTSEGPSKRIVKVKAISRFKGSSGSYKIQRGDTLEQIAIAHGVSLKALAQANGLAANTNLVVAGKTLQIPGGPQVKRATATNNAAHTEQAVTKNIAVKQATAANISTATEKAVEADAKSIAAKQETTHEELLFKDEATKATATNAAPIKDFAPIRSEQPDRNGPSMLATSGMLIGLIAKLGLVLALAYLGALAAKRLAGGRGASPRSEGLVKVMETVSLGPNRWVHVITVGEQAYLIGSTPQQTALMAEIHDSAAIRDLLHKDADGTSFASRLGQLLGIDKERAASGNLAGMSSFLTGKLAELRQLKNSMNMPEKLG